MLTTTQLRAEFAARMSAAYGREVPAYNLLVEVCEEINAEVLARYGDRAQRFGTLSRVTAERHGAIRLGTPVELRQASRIFAAFGMYPVGFYDLREAAQAAVPVVSTAFRPIEPDELARNPFRMFTSLLVTDDRRFFDAELQQRLDEFLAKRELFGTELVELAELAIAANGLSQVDAGRLLTLATDALALSDETVDAAWYSELESISAVAADIGGLTSTHINHLTPRVLDIDELYARMTQRGIEMIDRIEGPAKTDGVAVLLRQTSFRALAEDRRFRTPEGDVVAGTLRVRFGEVEARGIALTAAGRDRYDAGLALPATEIEFLRAGLAFFTFTAGPTARTTALSKAEKVDIGTADNARLAELVEAGVLRAAPIVYEDFLPRSAAGIFQSNLTSEGQRAEGAGSHRDIVWLSGVIGSPVADPLELYAEEQQASLASAVRNCD
jgi:uncharacterized glyoxalase superfamily metalloenzyme YdcJ